MPHSLVLNLIPNSPIYPDFLSGRHLHALFLEIVSSVDRPLGDRLHQQATDKAFTLSPLQVQGSRQMQWQQSQPIPAGTPCWWRISLLDDQLFGHLAQLWLNLSPSNPWHLGSADLLIASILGTPQLSQPWAHFMPYAQLFEQASCEQRSLKLEFVTPVSFRQGERDTAMPDRDRLFGSLLRRWNQYSGLEFSPDLIELLFPSYFDIRTALVEDSRSKLIGCVGKISFRIFGEPSPEQIQQLNALTDFALFSGIGRKTPMGMGMARRY
jgi:CRISPR-associated endoribonuclease Cas6